jgi:chemotaxis protein MotC
MMKRVRVAVAVLAALCSLPLAAFAAETEETLIKQIRASARQYDGIADRGLSQAPDLLQVRGQYLKSLQEAAAAGSRSQAMREMAEVYVLSGGDSKVLAHWKEGLDPDSAEGKFFEGVSAYGAGRTLEAEAKLLHIDAASLAPWRGGHLALAQALLTIRTEPKRAFRYLRTAALLLPGTLVEEAALRQSAILAARTGDVAEFSTAIASYFRRFTKSAYLPGFEAQVMFYIVRFGDQDGVRILRELLRALPDGWGRCLHCFLTTIAEQAILTGKIELAGVAAGAALPLASADGRERERLLLYSGAAAILTGKFEEGLASLHSIQQEKLREDDRRLLDATLSVADKVRKTPMLSTQLQRSASLLPVKGNRAFHVSSREEAARHALADADAILNSAQ